MARPLALLSNAGVLVRGAVMALPHLSHPRGASKPGPSRRIGPPMRIGLALPHYGFSGAPGSGGPTWPGLLDAARRAGRVGFGSGWGSESGRGGERSGRLEERVRAVWALFGQEERVALWEGEVRFAGAFTRPGRVQPRGPPIWVGGKGGPRLMRLVARHADGWNVVWRITPEAYAERIAELERVCPAEGRDPATVRRSVGLSTLVGEDERDLERRYEALRRW